MRSCAARGGNFSQFSSTVKGIRMCTSEREALTNINKAAEPDRVRKQKEAKGAQQLPFEFRVRNFIKEKSWTHIHGTLYFMKLFFSLVQTELVASRSRTKTCPLIKTLCVR